MISPVEIGNKLRDRVVDLLEARGFAVEREIRVDTKKIDLLLIEEDSLSRRKIAIECKNLERNLSQNELTHIYADYFSLLQRKEVDGVWVIVRQDYSPEAKNWARQQFGLEIFTIAQFEERQFGFHKLTRQLIELFSDQGLDQYYVEQRIAENEFLGAKVREWIESDDPNPVAILGGYGMGKTSFCKYLVADLGKRYLADQLSRVPIYVRLSDIAKEQDLEGLLGKVLAAQYRLSNYNFRDVMNLNERGAFVFIFDGFDEMKHALTWELFKYNFAQINRTVSKNSKVLIAGRPNAFLSDAEHSWALRGTRISGERLIRMPEWPEYTELMIQPFSSSEAEIFLRKYLIYGLTKNEKNVTEEDRSWIDIRVGEFQALSNREDFARPVHLKIFADIATNKDLTLKHYNVYELYVIATEATIGREMEKLERLDIPAAKRTKFIEDIAWWLWEEEGGRTLNFHPQQVPASILLRVLTSSQQTLDEGLMREVFSGAFIERKFGNNFYFAHRSFLEFFVAKKLISDDLTKIALKTIDTALNQEILEFVRASGKFSKLVEYMIGKMENFVGELKLMLLLAVRELVVSGGRRQIQYHTDLVLRCLPLYENDDLATAKDAFDEVFESDLVARDQEQAQSALYFLVDAIIFYMQNSEFKSRIDGVIRFLVGNVDLKYWTDSKAELSMPALSFSRKNIFEYVFLRTTRVAAELGPSGVPTLLIDFGRIFSELAELRKPKITVISRPLNVTAGNFVYSISINEVGLSAVRDRLLLANVLRSGIDTRVRSKR